MIVGYVRVSSEAQGADGYGLPAQEDAIRRACAAREWPEPRLVREVASGSRADRPQLAQALDTVAGDHGTLMVARLDRLSRSVGHFAGILDRAQEEGWQVVCLDPSVDMSTPYGRAMAGMAAVFAQLERELISQRTREGLQAAQARGVQVGSPRKVDPVECLAMADAGMSQSAIAREFGCSQSRVSRTLAQMRRQSIIS